MKRPALTLIILLMSALATSAQRDLKKATQQAIDAFFGSGAQAPAARLLATLSDRRITESSGLVASRRNPGVLWTHNDSGDGPYLFAIDRKGRTLARFRVTGATSVDWEDIAIGPGSDGAPALYIGDIGDNGRSRSDLAIYRVREPAVSQGRTLAEAQTTSAERFPFRYPDRAHDAETLLVHPQTGEIFIVTKSSDGRSQVFAYPLPLQADRQVTLQAVTTLTFTSMLGSGRLAEAERMTTGGDIASDGRHVVIRTYAHAYEWRITPGQSLADALKSTPTRIFLPLTRQGEAICYRADNRALLTTSEGAPAPLHEIPLSR
ncbi:MAG: hypothetical protein RMJ43_05785 [Chloroherpetonaceae bacterium]|nr:hypothetical protein [Chthonomonadaceae bacterium]MDW8207327.1 hypothetical protein [Chloroherpetonaceae bacterium]